MKVHYMKGLVAVSALTLPGIAFAQEIPLIYAALALSPVLAFLLAAILGLVRRSWRVAGRHAGWVAIWIVLFLVASYWVENDYVIWTPLALYGIHMVLMIILIVIGVLRRRSV